MAKYTPLGWHKTVHYPDTVPYICQRLDLLDQCVFLTFSFAPCIPDLNTHVSMLSLFSLFYTEMCLQRLFSFLSCSKHELQSCGNILWIHRKKYSKMRRICHVHFKFKGILLIQSNPCGDGELGISSACLPDLQWHNKMLEKLWKWTYRALKYWILYRQNSHPALIKMLSADC